MPLQLSDTVGSGTRRGVPGRINSLRAASLPGRENDVAHTFSVQWLVLQKALPSRRHDGFVADAGD
ncbi:hypothetical protein PTKU15_87440 [Paraburkholderia terrae]|nr:hypothetical protein PTKU15_87440 [Paraburkholderia terrae]